MPTRSSRIAKAGTTIDGRKPTTPHHGPVVVVIVPFTVVVVTVTAKESPITRYRTSERGRERTKPHESQEKQ